MAWTVKYCHPFGGCFFASSVFTKSRLTIVADCISLLFSIRVFRSAFCSSVIGPLFAGDAPYPLYRRVKRRSFHPATTGTAE